MDIIMLAVGTYYKKKFCQIKMQTYNVIKSLFVNNYSFLF